mmetsp:Transcript_73007/g.200417  ORF Transcript_73007/g.200417 Transcript_73007/m.200417 type:complete len:242 (-) Transcript_73007:3430-4155(-)
MRKLVQPGVLVSCMLDPLGINCARLHLSDHLCDPLVGGVGILWQHTLNSCLLFIGAPDLASTQTKDRPVRFCICRHSHAVEEVVEGEQCELGMLPLQSTLVLFRRRTRPPSEPLLLTKEAHKRLLGEQRRLSNSSGLIEVPWIKGCHDKANKVQLLLTPCTASLLALAQRRRLERWWPPASDWARCLCTQHLHIAAVQWVAFHKVDAFVCWPARVARLALLIFSLGNDSNCETVFVKAELC